MKLETAHTSHVGGRDEQQDAVAVLSRSNGETLLVLADGMGGHAGGSLASKTVIDAAERVWQETEKKRLAPRDLLAQVIAAAHDEINNQGDEQGLAPRSTCVLLHIDGDGSAGRATWAHIGDSRLYRFRDGELLGRTRDHSVVQMLVDLGKITEDEMATHPDQNRLTHSLGGEAPPQPDFGDDDVASGDTFLLCSDGLWEMVKPDEMLAALAGKDMSARAELLAKMAFERAGKGSDNISIAVVRAGGADSALAQARKSVGVAPAKESAKEGKAKPSKEKRESRKAKPAKSAASEAEPRPTKSAPRERAPRRSKGSPVLAFGIVALLAVGAAAAVVRPWEGFDEPTPAPAAPALAPMPVKPKSDPPKPATPPDSKPGETDPDAAPKPDADPTADPKDAPPAPDAKTPGAKPDDPSTTPPSDAEPGKTDTDTQTAPDARPDAPPKSE